MYKLIKLYQLMYYQICTKIVLNTPLIFVYHIYIISY